MSSKQIMSTKTWIVITVALCVVFIISIPFVLVFQQLQSIRNYQFELVEILKSQQEQLQYYAEKLADLRNEQEYQRRQIEAIESNDITGQRVEGSQSSQIEELQSQNI